MDFKVSKYCAVSVPQRIPACFSLFCNTTLLPLSTAPLPQAQLSLVTGETDYGRLEKCYSIWICRDGIPKDERYTISFYGIENTKNIRVGKMEEGHSMEGKHSIEKEKYDLMTLVIIKLGDRVYNGDKGSEGYGLCRFLNTVMYPHQEDFMEVVSEYIDFSENEELWKEGSHMFSLGQCIAEEAREEAREEGIQILVLDNLEEQVPEERILGKLQRRHL